MNKKSLARVRNDIRHVVKYFPPQSPMHVVLHQHRLIRNKYSDGNGGACLFGLLSEVLPSSERISSRESLTKFFTGGSGKPFCESPDYLPAKYLVRLIDGDPSAEDRYPSVGELPWSFVISCLEEIIAERSEAPREIPELDEFVTLLEHELCGAGV